MADDAVSLPPGFRAAGLHCGIKRTGASDLGLLLADEPGPAAALFTTNQLLGCCVPLSRESLARSGGRVRAVLVNSGNANCATGEAGMRDGREVAARLARLLDCPAEQVLFLNTGVIGARLPADRIVAALPALHQRATPEGLEEFARAIMTTDTRPKTAAAHGLSERGARFAVAGAAKGAGMIHPDMATLLAFVLTDARAPDPNASLRRIADRTFHRLTIDGDTSPNDTALLWSSAHVAASTRALEDAAAEVARALSRAIAADGEGATRLVTIRVRGAPSERDAARIGRTIATSPLTKTAIFGRDPNWGRIIAAAARAGVPLQPAELWLEIGGARVYEAGTPRPENEPAARAHLLESAEVVIDLDLGRGTAAAECWTCDFSPDYVRINADYRS